MTSRKNRNIATITQAALWLIALLCLHVPAQAVENQTGTGSYHYFDSDHLGTPRIRGIQDGCLFARLEQCLYGAVNGMMGIGAGAELLTVRSIGPARMGTGLRRAGGFNLKSFRELLESQRSQLMRNKRFGDAFRDEIAEALRGAGRDVRKEVYKKTPFGKRFIDIEVSRDGRVLGGIETKAGGSRYTPRQRAKDNWLKLFDDYPVNVVRDR